MQDIWFIKHFICPVIHRVWQINKLFRALFSDLPLFPVPLVLLDYLVIPPTPFLPQMPRLGNRYYSISWDLSFAGKALITKHCWSEFAWHSRASTKEDVFKEGLKAERFWGGCPISCQHTSQPQEEPRQESPSQSSPGKEGFGAPNPHRPQQPKLPASLDGGLST